MADEQNLQDVELDFDKVANKSEQGEKETTNKNDGVDIKNEDKELDFDKVSNDKELQECQEKLKEAEDKYLRIHAEFENFKKRLEREKAQAIEFANEKFAKDLLSMADTLEMALNAFDGDTQAQNFINQVKEGIELTKKNLLKTFEKHGISEVETSEFDPNHHDAIMQESSDEHEDGEIIQVLQKGYKYNDRLLRPAMVKICKK